MDAKKFSDSLLTFTCEITSFLQQQFRNRIVIASSYDGQIVQRRVQRPAARGSTDPVQVSHFFPFTKHPRKADPVNATKARD